jgi:hypothetical protein
LKEIAAGFGRGLELGLICQFLKKALLLLGAAIQEPMAALRLAMRVDPFDPRNKSGLRRLACRMASLVERISERALTATDWRP